MEDEKWKKLTREAWEQAQLAVEILERTKEGREGAVPVNIDEIKENVADFLGIEIDLSEFGRYLKRDGRKYFAEVLPSLRDVIERWNRRYNNL